MENTSKVESFLSRIEALLDKLPPAERVKKLDELETRMLRDLDCTATGQV